ncbi:MAG: protein kinase [Candidatus Obscuribacterales bacterium]|nr:protein kinase [Candidatus Obscuribacterales bacterium]
MTEGSLDTVDLNRMRVTVGFDRSVDVSRSGGCGETAQKYGNANCTADDKEGNANADALMNAHSTTEPLHPEVTLEKILKHDGPVHVLRALNIFLQCCKAMLEEHARGVVHGDLSPRYIAVSFVEALCPSCARGKIYRRFFRWCKNDGCSMSAVGRTEGHREEIRICGFGVDRLSYKKLDTRTFTRTSDLFCSAQYLSPEHCMGATVDARSDIYSLGCIVHEMLCGTPPFGGSNQAKTLLRHLEEEPTMLLAPTLSLRSSMYCREMVPLQMIVRKCLEKDPGRRYQTADELLRDLEMLQSGYYMQTMPKSWPPGEFVCYWYPPRGRRFLSTTRFFSAYSYKSNSALAVFFVALCFSPLLSFPWLFGFSNSIVGNLLWMSPGFLLLSVFVTAVVGHKLFKLRTAKDSQANPGDHWLQLLYASILIDLVLFSIILLVALLTTPPFYCFNLLTISFANIPLWVVVMASVLVALPMILFLIWLVRKIGSDENRSGW